jgi:hypothetical protein
MKKRKLIVVLHLTLFISCTKSKDDTTIFEVFEYKTNTPIPNVKIDLLRCTNYDLVFGCQSTTIFATGYTDNNGRYSFKQSVFNRTNEGIKLFKPNYCNTAGYPGKNYLATEGWINLHLIRQNIYTFPILYFDYDISGESGITYANPLEIPVDTIIKIRAFGNQVNKINWAIGTQSNWDFHSVVPLTNGTLTQNMDRFGTGSIILSY